MPEFFRVYNRCKQLLTMTVRNIQERPCFKIGILDILPNVIWINAETWELLCTIKILLREDKTSADAIHTACSSKLLSMGLCYPAHGSDSLELSTTCLPTCSKHLLFTVCLSIGGNSCKVHTGPVIASEKSRDNSFTTHLFCQGTINLFVCVGGRCLAKSRSLVGLFLCFHFQWRN